METREPRLTQWRVVDTFRLREVTTDNWHMTHHKMTLRVPARRHGEKTYELVDRSQANPMWRRLLRNIFRLSTSRKVTRIAAARALAERIKS